MEKLDLVVERILVTKGSQAATATLGSLLQIFSEHPASPWVGVIITMSNPPPTYLLSFFCMYSTTSPHTSALATLSCGGMSWSLMWLMAR